MFKCTLTNLKLESEGQVSPDDLVIYIAVQFGFGVVVSNGTNDVFSEGVVSAYAITFETSVIEGVSISGVCYISLSTLVIVVSEQAIVSLLRQLERL